MMAETKNGALGIEKATEMVEQLRKSLDEMESHTECLSHEESLLEDVKQHFDNIKNSLQQKFSELETKEKTFEEKKAEYQTLVAEKEASVQAMEQDLYDRLHELKDVAVSAILEAQKNYTASLENKVSTSAYEDPNASKTDPVEKISVNTPDKANLQRQVKQLCEQMNAKDLVKFISDNRKTLATMHDVLAVALRCAKDPADLVLNAIEAFYPPNESDLSRQLKDNNLQYLRRTCFQLLESAAPLLGMAEPGSDNFLSFEIKQRAKIIADDWIARLAVMNLDASNGYSLEAISFLQLLVTFSISSEFDEDELCKLVISVSRHRNQTPELCRALRLAHKTQDMVRALVLKGRQLDAAFFSYTFQLTDIFPLAPLLKQHLEDTKKLCTQIEVSGTERDTANQELGALKAVIRCIDEYKLHEKYPPDALHIRVAEIEKAKADKKRKLGAASVQTMKPSSNIGYASLKNPIDNRLKPHTVYDERVRYYGSKVKRQPYAAAPVYQSGDNRYPYVAPPAYEVSGYGGNNMYPYVAPSAFEVSGPKIYIHYQEDRITRPPGSDVRVPQSSFPNYGSYMTPPNQSAPANYGNYINSGMQQAASSSYGNYTGSTLPPTHQSFM